MSMAAEASKTLRRVLAAITVRVLLVSMWILRRLDYYLNKSTTLIDFDQFRADPYKSYNKLRSRAPILRSFANRGYMILGYNEVQSALRDPAFSSDFTRNKFILRLANAASGERSFPLLENPPFLNQDPPDHTRLRRLAGSGFTNRYIQSLRPNIERATEELLDAIDNECEFDLIARLAEPLPAIVIADMMGVPTSDRHHFIAWSHGLTGATMITEPALMARAAIAEEEMRIYLRTLIARKAKSPSDDFISRLVGAETPEDSMTEDEAISICILLLTAGHETTTRLIGNGMHTLMNNKAQFDLLTNDRSLMENAIEEILRFEPPVQETVRFVAEDTEFHGHNMKEGQMILVNFAAANRDPAANKDPDRFDITRDAISHVAFGYGIHHCLGLALARLEASVVFNALFDRYSNFAQVDGTLSWQGNPFFRGLETLRIKTRRRV